MSYILVKENSPVHIAHTETDLTEGLTGGLPLHELEFVTVWILNKCEDIVSLFRWTRWYLVA